MTKSQQYNLFRIFCNRVSLLALCFVLSVHSSYAADLKGTVTSSDGQSLCALALASGVSVFTCDPLGQFSFTNLPLESDGTIKLQVYADGFFPKITTLSEFSTQYVVLERASCGGGGGGGGSTTSRQKTEKLIGRWFFEYTIITSFNSTYTLFGPAEPNTSTSGDWVVFGEDEYGNDDVIAGYFSQGNTYTLLDESILFDYFYAFDFSSDNKVSGCYYQVYDDGALGTCYPLNGTRLSSVTSASSEPLRQLATTELADQEKLAKEVEAHNLAIASLNMSSEETADEATKRAQAKQAYERLRAQIQAR